MLAQRFGIPVPELADDGERTNTRARSEREALLKVHEVAAAGSSSSSPTPRRAAARASSSPTAASRRRPSSASGSGYAPPSREGLKAHLLKQGFSLAAAPAERPRGRRDSGETLDRFRNRLMIPICRDTGAIIAFGGRAMDADQQPKYLNSPETPIYAKGRTLYGLHLSKAAIRQAGYAVLVEGYFDVAQVLQAGVAAVVASSGTALTPQQAQLLRRFTSKVVLSFDPDAAGQGAAVRSCELLVAEGFR